MTIENLCASAWQNAITETANFLNEYGHNYSLREDWVVVEAFATVYKLIFDENGYLKDFGLLQGKP